MTEAQAAEHGPTEPRYDFNKIDLESGSVHADVVRLVDGAPRVLELGPATGYMSRTLTAAGSAVVGIELDAEMAERANEFCERVIVGDIDALDLGAELGDERFDAVVAADVLEHLKDPLEVLNRLRPFLKPDGFFVISVPNVAHGSVRLALLSGDFKYRDIGLLDSTHLRFFTRETLERLLDDAELGMIEMCRHELDLDASEVAFDAAAVPAALREELEHDPEARTYQFVVKAIPMERDGLRELQRRLREVAELRVAAERVGELEKSLAAISGREADLRRGLIEAHDQLLRKDAELVILRKDVETYRIRLEAMLASPPVRIYARLQGLPVIRTINRRRKARFDAELAKRIDQNG
jgi:2-polyprenyl-3-methyl-5-hydroxy-6-metoxy-1,4-benzoquinol methylase